MRELRSIVPPGDRNLRLSSGKQMQDYQCTMLLILLMFSYIFHYDLILYLFIAIRLLEDSIFLFESKCSLRSGEWTLHLNCAYWRHEDTCAGNKRPGYVERTVSPFLKCTLLMEGCKVKTQIEAVSDPTTRLPQTAIISFIDACDSACIAFLNNWNAAVSQLRVCKHQGRGPPGQRATNHSGC